MRFLTRGACTVIISQRNLRIEPVKVNQRRRERPSQGLREEAGRSPALSRNGRLRLSP